MNNKDEIIILIGKLDEEKENKFLSQILIMIKTHMMRAVSKPIRSLSCDRVSIVK